VLWPIVISTRPLPIIWTKGPNRRPWTLSTPWNKPFPISPITLEPVLHAIELEIPGLRCWPIGRYPYLIFYVELSNCVDVWRILNGKRHIPAWMQEPA